MPICYCYKLPEGFEVREAFPTLEGVILMWRLFDIRKPVSVVICSYTEKPKELDVRRAVANYKEWGGDEKL